MLSEKAKFGNKNITLFAFGFSLHKADWSFLHARLANVTFQYHDFISVIYPLIILSWKLI